MSSQHDYNHIYLETFNKWKGCAEEIIKEGEHELSRLDDSVTCPIYEDSKGIITVGFLNDNLRTVAIKINRYDVPRDTEGGETIEGIKAAMRHELTK